MLKYLHSGEASVGQQNWTVGIPLRKRTAGGTPSHHHYLVTLLWQVLISQMLIHLDVQMNRYFSKVVWPNCDNITSSWGEVSPRLLSQELSYPSLVTTNPLEVKIISILLYKNNNSPTLFCTFTIDNSSFLTTIKKKMWEKEINSKCFPFWNGCTVCLAQLTFMALYLSHCDVTAWQTWSNKTLQYLGMKL